MTEWHSQPVAIKFQVSDLTLFSARLPLAVRSVSLGDERVDGAENAPPSAAPQPGTQGYYIHALPIGSDLPVFSRVGDYIRYVPLQYQHCYIDLRIGFDAYQQKFSSKTRATILRKIRRFEDYSGGTIGWRTYRTAAELEEFHRLARKVSSKTYQERLLDAGIPDDGAFVTGMLALARQDQLRAYILFDQALPVAYLYCPLVESALVYAYLGYDPAYLKHSVGTVLQWLAVEQMFAERQAKFFDFTEGQSDHKRLFATNQLRCANVMFVRRTPYTVVLLRSHAAMDRLVSRIARMLDRSGLRTRLRQLLRRAG